jgi:prophage DNA circulation protein
MATRKKRQTPIMLLWSKQEQRRFVDAVERLISAIGDLQMVLAEPKRRAEAANNTRNVKAMALQAALDAALRSAAEEFARGNGTASSTMPQTPIE